jgi:hypothetical protein
MWHRHIGTWTCSGDCLLVGHSLQLRKFTKKKKKSEKVPKQQIAFWTVREQAEGTCKLHPYQTTLLQNLCDTDNEVRLNFVNCHFTGRIM